MNLRCERPIIKWKKEIAIVPPTGRYNHLLEPPISGSKVHQRCVLSMVSLLYHSLVSWFRKTTKIIRLSEVANFEVLFWRKSLISLENALKFLGPLFRKHTTLFKNWVLGQQSTYEVFQLHHHYYRFLIHIEHLRLAPVHRHHPSQHQNVCRHLSTLRSLF